MTTRGGLWVMVMWTVVGAAGPLRASEAEDSPKVGLALSGGGALGSAHVGVLKVLEELHVPVHYVAGTSMGAIVGGLYSAGVSPAEMERIFAEIDWRDTFEDRPPRRRVPYRRKVDDQTYLTRFEVGLNGEGFHLPPGLLSGQKLGFKLQELCLRAAGVEDFDRLPIPFRAVATDIESGEMVVLGHGDLAQAIRASMSIPAVFSPIEIDGRLLVDGGLVRNLPVDVVREMGAEVVIAVDVGQPLLTKDELASLARVTNQMIGMQIRKNVQQQAPLADVLIEPDLEGFSGSQFEKALEMVPLGEAAARRAAAALSELAVSEDRFAAHLAAVRRREEPPATVASIQLTLGSTADSKQVLSRVRTRPGDPFDLEAVRRDVERLYETGDYERVGFFLIRTGDDYAVHLEAHDKSWGPNYLRFGLNLFADFEGESSFDLLTSYTMTKLNRLRGELKVQAQLGENPTASAELYQPLSLSQTWFFSAQVQQSTASMLLPAGDGLFAPYRVDAVNGGLDLGLQLGEYAELRLGLTRTIGRSRPRSGSVPAESENALFEQDFDLGGLRFTAVVDQFDNMNFPRHGYFSYLGAFAARESLGSDSDYERLVGFLGGAASRGRHTLLGLANFYSALGSDSPEINSLGGLFSLSGNPPDSITGRYGGSASLLYLYRLFQIPRTVGDGLYVGASFEAGNLWDEQDQVDFGDLRYAGSVYVGVDTAFGPLYFAQGWAEGGETATYLFVGRTF